VLASIWLPFFFQFSKASQLLKLLLYAAEPAKSMAAPAANATPMGEECRGHRDSDGAARQCRQRIQASSPSSRWCSSSSTRSSWPFAIEDSVGAAEPLLALAGSRFKLHGELHGRGTLHSFPLLHRRASAAACGLLYATRRSPPNVMLELALATIVRTSGLCGWRRTHAGSR